jgi:hypothetical protein
MSILGYSGAWGKQKITKPKVMAKIEKQNKTP